MSFVVDERQRRDIMMQLMEAPMGYSGVFGPSTPGGKEQPPPFTRRPKPPNDPNEHYISDPNRPGVKLREVDKREDG